jgi:hypothetical protein
MRFQVVFGCAFGMALSGCVSAQDSAGRYNADNLVAVKDVIGSIKCGYASALDREIALAQQGQRVFRRLEGRVVQMELTLKLVDGSAAGADAKLGPFVSAATGAGVSILPKFGASVSRTHTIDTTIKSRLGLQHLEDDVCAAVSATGKLDESFSIWLATLIDGLDAYAGYSPAGIVDSVTYDGQFQVVRKANTGAEFTIAFVSASANASSERSDIQHIKMTVRAPSKEVPFPKEAYRMSATTGKTEVNDDPGAGMGVGIQNAGPSRTRR